MHSAKPLTDAFTHWANLKQILISLSATAGQGVIWYTGCSTRSSICRPFSRSAQSLPTSLWLLPHLCAIPFYVASERSLTSIGRKKLMMVALLLAVLCYIPIYKGMQQAAGNNVVSVSSVKDKVTGAIKLTPLTVDPATGTLLPAKEAVNANSPMLIFLVWIQIILACLIYGPLAAYLVEAFPAKVRYTSLSLPYHIGNGVFGGLLPLIGLGLCASTGNIYAGLYYPIGVCVLSLVFGMLLLKETHGTLIWDEAETARRRSRDRATRPFDPAPSSSPPQFGQLCLPPLQLAVYAPASIK